MKNTQDLVTIGADKYNVHAVLARMQILFFSPVTNSCHHYQLHYCFVCINSIYMNKLLNAAAILVAKIAEAVNKLQAVKFSSGNFSVHDKYKKNWEENQHSFIHRTGRNTFPPFCWFFRWKTHHVLLCNMVIPSTLYCTFINYFKNGCQMLNFYKRLSCDKFNIIKIK